MAKFLLSVAFMMNLAVISFAQEAKIRERFKMKRDSLLKVMEIKREQQARTRYTWLVENQRKDTVKIVDLSDLKLEEFPELVFEFPNMTRLDISANYFYRIPRKLRKMDSLEVLIWSGNNFNKSGLPTAKIPRKIKLPRKTNIKKLYLNNNQLVELPSSLKRLRKLESFSAANNELRNLDGRLKNARSLKLLTLDQNPLAINSIKWKKIPSSLEILRLNKCGLTEISAAIYDLNVRDLQFRENAIRIIPEGISKMDSLRKLSFYKNQMEKLPADFYDLKKLMSLDLYYNLLDEISPAITKFDSLSILYIAHNRLYDVPEEIGNMTQLQELYLHHNQLNSLPASFSKLKSLKTLRLNDNNMPEFPEAVLGMESLEFLDISSNLLETLPEELKSLTRLKLFTYDKNQIDFRAASNRHVAPMIAEMAERGVICDPTVKKETVTETN